MTYYAAERENKIIMDTEGHQNATPSAADRFDIPERFSLYNLNVYNIRIFVYTHTHTHTLLLINNYIIY